MTPGIEKAPAAVRDAGLPELLRAAGRTAHDHGDLPVERWRPDPGHPTAQNLDRVTAVAGRLADRVAEVLAAERVPLVLGGDCTVTVGAVAGCVRHGRGPFWSTSTSTSSTTSTSRSPTSRRCTAASPWTTP
jgi:arginase